MQLLLILDYNYSDTEALAAPEGAVGVVPDEAVGVAARATWWWRRRRSWGGSAGGGSDCEGGRGWGGSGWGDTC